MMRDYYLSYLGKKTEIPPRCEGAKGAEGAYAPFAPSVERDIPENCPLDAPFAPFARSLTEEIPETNRYEDLLIAPEDLEQFFFENEERVAIMIHDGGMAEHEAEVNARADVRSAWVIYYASISSLNNSFNYSEDLAFQRLLRSSGRRCRTMYDGATSLSTRLPPYRPEILP